ncbi:MAG: OmpH family outer membrane protein [Bacteroidota bacterium]
MKNLSILLNVVLLIAVAVLFYLQLGGSPEGVENTESEEGTAVKAQYATAYVITDSLLSKSDFVSAKRKELEEKAKKLQAEYQNRAQGLQTEINNYQRNKNNLTIGQARTIEEDLLKKEENLRLYSQSLQQEIINDEARMTGELYQDLTEYLKKYSGEKGIDMVVKYGQGGDVLFANNSMDITEDIINGLNELYNNPVEEETEATETTPADTTETAN